MSARRIASATISYKRRISDGGGWGNAAIEATSEVGASQADLGYAYGSSAAGARPVDLFRFDKPLGDKPGELAGELLAMINERDAEELEEALPSPDWDLAADGDEERWESERRHRAGNPHREWLRAILENAY